MRAHPPAGVHDSQTANSNSFHLCTSQPRSRHISDIAHDTLSGLFPLAFFVSVCFLSLLLFLPSDAAGLLFALSLLPPGFPLCVECVLSASTPFSRSLYFFSGRHSHSCGPSLATPVLPRISWHSWSALTTFLRRGTLVKIFVVLLFVFHFACPEIIFKKLRSTSYITKRIHRCADINPTTIKVLSWSRRLE
jgi:hypothetical protein